MTRRSLALLACALLLCASAQAATKKKHSAAPAKEASVHESAHQDIDVDAMARAKDGKPSEPLPKTAEEATAGAPPGDAAAAATNPAATMPAEAAADSASAKAAESASSAANAETTAPVAAPDGESMDRPSPLAPAAPSDTDQRIAAGCESRAKSLLDAAQKGDYAGATRDFDAKMRTALPPPKFKQAWESLSQFGSLQGRGQAHPMKGDGYIAITIPLIFDKANLYAQVACGSDGRVAGFYIKPL